MGLSVKDSSKKLRAEAEATLKKKSVRLQHQEDWDTDTLIHELSVHQIELEMQNTELQQTQKELEESQRKYTDLFNFAPVGYFVLDDKGSIVEVNLTGAAMIGFERSSLLKKPFTLCISREDRDIFYLNHRKAAKTGLCQQCELKMLRENNGGELSVAFTIDPIIDTAGKITQYRIVAVDITERKKAEEKLKDALDIKETLLQELHHRVKNNMQIISSLLRLQSRKVDDKKAAEIFRECQDRIQAMALIHERFYHSKDLSSIDFEAYVKELAQSLVQSYNISPGRITMNIDIKNVSLGINEAISCGLIINELVSNSLKYAFPQEDKKGKISVSMAPAVKNGIELIISDNGVGIPTGLDLQKIETFGLQIVSAFVKDHLDGEIKLDRSEGTKFRIKFEKKSVE